MILGSIIALITAKANDRVSMLAILQETFMIRAKDASMLDETAKAPWMGKDIYQFKFKKEN